MKPIKIDKSKIYHSSNFDYIYIYERTIEEFIETNPPCAECLVQPVCISYSKPVYIAYVDAAHEEFLMIKIKGII